MAKATACPECGTAMREIVWGYGTIADVADAGDVVIGGCVVDVDEDGRVAASECPACGTRADAGGLRLERAEPAGPVEHPLAVSFSSPPSEPWEVTEPWEATAPWEVTVPQSDRAQQREPQEPFGEAGQGFAVSSSVPFVDEDFGGAPPEAGWRERVEPYSSHEDPLPAGSEPVPEHVPPYASREDALPESGARMPDHVSPYASREDPVPTASAPAADRADPYASREDEPPERPAGWRERIDPYSA
jgi:hypothetical protein